MGLFRRSPRPVQPDDYFAAADDYLDFLRYCFEWNFDNRAEGRFFPLHVSACFGAAHAVAALLHSLPASPYFRRPGELDEESLERLLLRMEHVMAYVLIRQTGAADDRVRQSLEEACEFFAQSEATHNEGRAFAEELLAEDTWENRAGRLAKDLISGRGRGPGKVGLLAGYLTEPITEASDSPLRDGGELTVTNADFVVPCLDHGLELGLAMSDDIGEKGWERFVDELLGDGDDDSPVTSLKRTRPTRPSSCAGLPAPVPRPWTGCTTGRRRRGWPAHRSRRRRVG